MDWIVDFLGTLPAFALTWLPLIFFGLIIYLLWRTLAFMPRVKPAEIEPESKRSVRWDDIAGVDEAAIFAGRKKLQYVGRADFDSAMERVIAGLQQRRVVTEKEKRILAYHEAGHALMSHLVGNPQPVQKVTIVSRGRALGYTLNAPQEDRYLQTKEELVDLMKVMLAGRAAEQIVFGAVTNGAADDLERVTALARSMVFEYGMGDEVSSRTVRADNYALSEQTKRLRDEEQARLCDYSFSEAVRLLSKHRRTLDMLAGLLLEKETLVRSELEELLGGIEPESDASSTVGRVVQLPEHH